MEAKYTYYAVVPGGRDKNKQWFTPGQFKFDTLDEAMTRAEVLAREYPRTTYDVVESVCSITIKYPDPPIERSIHIDRPDGSHGDTYESAGGTP